MGKRICVVGCDLGPGPMNYLREQFPEFEFLAIPGTQKCRMRCWPAPKC